MNPDWLIQARLAHVLGVAIWIGGVGFVTAVLIPAVKSLDDATDLAEVFERLENRFAWIARGAVLIVGASGFYMVVQYRLWDRFLSVAFWWMDAMVAVWAIFAVILFVAEPLFLHRRFSTELRRNPDDLGRHTDHPIRVLSELCGFEDGKPFGFTKAVFEFCMKLLDRPDAWNGVHSPLEVLKPILSGEGVTTTSKGRNIVMPPPANRAAAIVYGGPDARHPVS